MNNAVTRNTLFTPFHLQGGFKAYFRCNYSNLFIEYYLHNEKPAEHRYVGEKGYSQL